MKEKSCHLKRMQSFSAKIDVLNKNLFSRPHHKINHSGSFSVKINFIFCIFVPSRLEMTFTSNNACLAFDPLLVTHYFFSSLKRLVINVNIVSIHRISQGLQNCTRLKIIFCQRVSTYFLNCINNRIHEDSFLSKFQKSWKSVNLKNGKMLSYE